MRFFWHGKRAIIAATILSVAAATAFAQSGSTNSVPANSATSQQDKPTQITPAASDKVAPVAPAGSGTQITGSATNTAQSTATPAVTTSTVDEIKLDAGDVISIKVYGAPELSDEQRLSAEGDVYLALIGTVHLQGLTPEEAQRVVESKLRDGGFLRDPHVTVFVKEYATAGVSVLGEVAKPGTYQMIGTHHLFDAISLAGGETQRAGNEITITHRNAADKPVHVELEGDISQSAASNVEIFPGDTIVVAKAGVVYVIGDVHAPGGYVIEHNHPITALRALAMAQGSMPTASLKHARIVRRDAQGNPTEVHIDLKKIEDAKAPDVTLLSDDVLFIPTSKGAAMMHTTAGSILNAAVGMAVYHPY